MELHDAIKAIVDQFGKDILAEKRVINMIADYHSFRDNPAEKIIITAIVNAGYSARLLKIPSGEHVSIIEHQITKDICNNFGFREDLVSAIIECMISCIGISTPMNNTITTSSDKPLSKSIQANSQILPYSEEYIMSLYPILFENISYHSRMDFDIFQGKLQMESNEAFRLFKFLKGMGVYIFNPYSDNYDIDVDSIDSLRDKYRNYVVQQGMIQIPLSNGELLERKYLVEIIKKLYKYKFISLDNIKSTLSSLNDYHESSLELFSVLKQFKVIDEWGRCLNPYMTPEAMVNDIITKIFVNQKNMINSPQKTFHINEHPTTDGVSVAIKKFRKMLSYNPIYKSLVLSLVNKKEVSEDFFIQYRIFNSELVSVLQGVGIIGGKFKKKVNWGIWTGYKVLINDKSKLEEIIGYYE